MTRVDLKSIPGFIEWAERGEANGFFRNLSECVDDEIGNIGLPNTDAHESHINLGMQMAVRLTRQLISDPLQRKVQKLVLPKPTYGVITPATNA